MPDWPVCRIGLVRRDHEAGRIKKIGCKKIKSSEWGIRFQKQFTETGFFLVMVSTIHNMCIAFSQVRA